MFLDKYVKIKDKAIEKADEAYSELQQEIKDNHAELRGEYFKELTEEQRKKTTIFNDIVVTPKEYLDFIYRNTYFKKYLQYALVVKNIDKKILLIKAGLVVLSIILAILITSLMSHSGISIIIAVILVFGTAIFTAITKTGVPYEEYYTKTMSKLMISILPGYRFEEVDQTEQQQKNNRRTRSTIRSRYYLTKRILTTEELQKHFSELFDFYKEDNTLLYTSPEAAGGMCDLEIGKKVKNTNKQTGKVEVKDETIFNGFYIKNKIRNKSNLLNEYMIEIREDENLLSALTEDTMHSIYKSEKNFTFNTEELNKALDCKIKYENIADKAIKETTKFAKKTINNIMGKENEKEDIIEESIDPVFLLNKIITPGLEEHLLYLRKRYNAFNMDLTNSYISFNVNLNQTFFQRLQSKQVWGNEYKKQTQSVTFIKPNLFGNGDFEYYRVFPMLEKIFFIHYMNLLYRYALKKEDITRVELDIMKNFEQEMEEILDGDYKEYKQLYMDDLKDCNNMVKDTTQEVKTLVEV